MKPARPTDRIAWKAFPFAILFALPLQLLADGAPIGPATFTGFGVNDATSGGVYTSPVVDAAFVITISSTGVSDSFTWVFGNSARSPSVPITGGAQSLSNGVTIKFAAKTGHRIGDSWTIRATTGLASDFLASGNAATRRSSQEKARDFVNVKDYGAVCDGGITDDRVAIQAAIDAVGFGTLYLPAAGCGVSMPGIFLYPSNDGMNLIGLGAMPPGEYVGGAGGGLIAYAASPPTSLLTSFAAQAKFENLYLDCNNGAATHGMVSAIGNSDIWNDVTTRKCSGDGALIWNEGTPTTTLTANVSAGETSISVTSVTNNRLTFGKYYCPYIMIEDPGATNVDGLRVSSISGTTVHLSSALKYSHTTSSTAQCHGNDNELHIDHYASFGNKGWGFRVMPGNDNNAITFAHGVSAANALGGELWFGSAHKHFGGDYEADGGPAVQLGDSTHAGGTYGMSIDPLGDVEESSDAFSAVVAVCDSRSQVRYEGLSTFVIVTSSTPSPLPKSCSTYPMGSSTMGFGPNDTTGQFTIKTALGVYIFDSWGGQHLAFADPAGAELSRLAQSSLSGSGMESQKDVNDFGHYQFAVTGKTQPTYKMGFGFRSDLKVGFLQSTVYGTSNNPLLLNPAGGAVGTGTGGFFSRGASSFYTAPNWIVSESGANNALVATLNDPQGNPVPVAEGLRISMALSTYSLQAGANTLNLNGSGAKNIADARNPANPIGAVAIGGVVELVLHNGAWLMTSSGPSTGGRTVTYTGVPTNCTLTGGVPSGCTNTTLTFVNGVLK